MMTLEQTRSRPWIRSKPQVDRVTGEITWVPPLPPEVVESLRLGIEQHREQHCSMPHHAMLARNAERAGRHEMAYWAVDFLSSINLRPMERFPRDVDIGQAINPAPAGDCSK